MKKLTTFFILVFIISSGLFANPEIPVIDNYFNSTKEDYTGTNYLFYINNSGTNSYKIFAEIDERENTLWFRNKSLLSDIEITLCMEFLSKDDLENYIRDIDTTDLESEFNDIRRSFIKYNITPIYSTNENNSITNILYIAHQE